MSELLFFPIAKLNAKAKEWSPSNTKILETIPEKPIISSKLPLGDKPRELQADRLVAPRDADIPSESSPVVIATSLKQEVVYPKLIDDSEFDQKKNNEMCEYLLPKSLIDCLLNDESVDSKETKSEYEVLTLTELLHSRVTYYRMVYLRDNIKFKIISDQVYETKYMDDKKNVFQVVELNLFESLTSQYNQEVIRKNNFVKNSQKHKHPDLKIQQLFHNEMLSLMDETIISRQDVLLGICIPIEIADIRFLLHFERVLDSINIIGVLKLLQNFTLLKSPVFKG